jgi:hypothetical protein
MFSRFSFTYSPRFVVRLLFLIYFSKYSTNKGYGPIFNYGEFAIIKNQAGLNNYKISVKDWVEKTKTTGRKTLSDQCHCNRSDEIIAWA